MTALAVVGITIGTFLEVDNTPQQSSKETAPSLVISADVDPFLVFPCTIQDERSHSRTSHLMPNSLTTPAPHYDLKEATRQFLFRTRIQPRFILDGSTSSSQGDTVVVNIHTEGETVAALALCDTGATLNLYNRQLADSLVRVNTIRMTKIRRATHTMGIRDHSDPKSYQKALILLSLTRQRPLIIKVVIMDNMVQSMPLILACGGFNNRLVSACGLVKLSTGRGRRAMYCSNFPEPELCPILTPEEIEKSRLRFPESFQKPTRDTPAAVEGLPP